MIRSDIHLHTSFSSDCDEPMESQIEQAVSLGLTTLCFTEHMDKDYPSDPLKEKSGRPEFYLDTDSYREHYLRMKEKYSGKIRLLFADQYTVIGEVSGIFIHRTGIPYQKTLDVIRVFKVNHDIPGAMARGVPVMRFSTLPVTLTLSYEARIVFPILTLPSEREKERENSP